MSLLLMLLFAISTNAVAEPNAAPLAAEPAPPADVVVVPTPTQLMEAMTPETIALQVGEMSITWQELRPMVQRSPMQEAENAQIAVDNYHNQVRALLRRLAIRSLLLQEARARGIAVTEEEKQANLNQLRQGLQESATELDVDGFLTGMKNAEESSLLVLTVEDAQKVVKMGNQLFALIKIDDAEVEQRRQKDQGMRNMLKQQNEQRRQQLQDLLQNEDINTDRGFARLARRFSEGTEARQDGELDMDFTREQLAEVNHLEEFSLLAGQTSAVMETPSAFRIMRVLREIPAEKNGEPNKLRVAQLLFRKFPEEDITLEESRQKVLIDRQRRILDVAGHGLSHRYPVKTPIFPQGLW